MVREEKIEKLIAVAKSLIGVPYKYGAQMKEAPEFFDCSGFVKYIFLQVGIELPRSTIEQAVEGEEVTKDNLQPGDLIFLHDKVGHYDIHFPQGIGHVVLYIGDGEIIHAASKRIQERPIIIEKGEVREESLEGPISLAGPIIIIKRIIS